MYWSTNVFALILACDTLFMTPFCAALISSNALPLVNASENPALLNCFNISKSFASASVSVPAANFFNKSSELFHILAALL